MRLYLRYIHPALALAVLALCIWARVETANETGELPAFGDYFLAQGLFCCSALLLLGAVADQMLGCRAQRLARQAPARESIPE